MVTETDRFVVIEPYAPRFPFETWILPKRHESHFEDSEPATLQNLAWVLRSTLRKIDKVLERPAYNFIVAQRAGAGRRPAALSLAYRDHSQADESGGVRVGHRHLYQPDAAGGIGAFPARCGTRLRRRARRHGCTSVSGLI